MPAVRVMLMLADREEISRGLAEGLPFTEIGLRLGRDSSVVSREVGRHGGREGYRAVAAQEVACAGRERPKRFAVERSPRLRAVVCAQLRQGWSLASIAGRETFILALEQWPTLAERYTAADQAGRRKLLETVVDRAPLPSIEAAVALTNRYAGDAIGWFASAEDICRAYIRLADLAAQPGLAPIASVLQVNDGGLQLDKNQWRLSWFKGRVGSGVLASAYLATTRTGRSYVVAAMAENPSQPIVEGADLSMLAAIRGAFTLAAQS
jgi:Helix-turn-helix domain